MKLSVEREVKQKFLRIKSQIAIWKTQLNNVTYDLKRSFTTK